MIERIKYPRTPHLPWSPGITNDDRVIDSLDNFIDKDVIVAIKLDGENTSCYSDGYVHARSLDTDSHYTRSYVKKMWNEKAFNLDPEWRICGENVAYKHSIHYTNLDSYFSVFSVWDNNNVCLSWDDTELACSILSLPTVPVLYKGKWNEGLIKSLYRERAIDNNEMEGYVVRLSSSFAYDEFDKSVAKFVRQNHLLTNDN